MGNEIKATEIESSDIANITLVQQRREVDGKLLWGTEAKEIDDWPPVIRLGEYYFTFEEEQSFDERNENDDALVVLGHYKTLA